MARLPQPGSDNGTWGEVLNDYLSQSHNADGSLKDIPQSKVTNLTTALASKADTSAIPTTPAQVGAEPAGLSVTTRNELNATFVTFGPTAPDHTVAPVWVDTSTVPPVLKGWDGSAWIALSSDGGTTPPEPTLLYGLRIMGAGDSIEGLGGNGTTLMGDSPSAYTSQVVGDKVRFCGVVQRSGNTVAQYNTNGLPELLTSITTYSVETVLVLLGTNDAGDSSFSAGAFQSAYLALCDAIEDAGARPLLRTIPPRGESSAKPRVTVINDIIKSIAAQRGYVVLDYFAAADDGTNGWKAGYSIDNVHPSPLGVKAMVTETAAALRTNLTAADSFFPTATGADSGNLIASTGFFTSGGGNGNADVGAGWRTFSTAITPSFVTEAGVPGRMQRLTVAGTGNRNLQSLSTYPVTAGHLYRFGAAFKAVGFETEAARTAGATYSLSIAFFDSGGGTLGNSIGLISSWESDLDLGWPNFARVAPTGAVSARATLGISSGGQVGSYVQMGAVTMRDLSVTAPATPTTTALVASPSNSAPLGDAVTLTATVSPSGAAGTVQFRDGGNVLTDVPTVGGVATFSTSDLTTGSHTLTAVFLPSGPDYSTSTSSSVSYTIGAARVLYSLGAGNDDYVRRNYGPDIPGSDGANIETWPEAHGGTAMIGGSTRRATRTTEGLLTFARFTGNGTTGALLDGAPVGPSNPFTIMFAFRLNVAYTADFLTIDGYRIRRASNGLLQVSGNGGNIVLNSVSLGAWHTLTVVGGGTGTRFMLDNLADAGPGSITAPSSADTSLYRFVIGASTPDGTMLDIAEPVIWSRALDRTARETARTALITQYPALSGS